LKAIYINGFKRSGTILHVSDTVGEFKNRLPTVGYANGSGDLEKLTRAGR
jgi:hypothetical protein